MNQQELLAQNRPLRRKPVFNRNGDKLVDQRVSICSNCNAGIFKGDAYIWSTAGLIHTRCDTRPNETKDTTT